MRSALAHVRRAPRDPEARRRLRALAADQGAWEQLAPLLADEARAAAARKDATTAAAFFEELADVHENLDQQLETIVAMEAVVELEPERVDQHDRLAWLYRRAGAWQKAARAFERVAELARDDRGRAALRAAGKIYRDNGRLERAAETYRAVVERKPGDLDAWRALDELLSQLGRWAEVADVRGELARRSPGGVDKAALLRGQARALEQAGEMQAAARLVAEAANHAPNNVSGIVDYADVLARGGQGREAAAIIAASIDEAIDRGASTQDVAALRLRLATILDDLCRDRAAATAVLRDLLAAAPDYVPALERLASLAAQAGDTRAHAVALLRYAVALPPDPSRVPMIASAARRASDEGDHALALRALEQAARDSPGSPAIARELEHVRVALGVAEARVAAASGDRDGAERKLRGLIASRPYSAPAALALADVASPPAAADVLRETLAAAPDDAPPAELARLVLRLAQITDDRDDAHQLLHEAHRLDRRSLAVTLALGESCFQRKLWREAALHLGALADHPDAAAHATEVAAGLVRAGIAETRALRPAGALRHYEAAVRIDPACAKAWHALADDALAQGDTKLAVECLEREADATTHPADRLRLWDALGDLALDVLGDARRAEACWAKVASAGHAPVLHKLLAVQRRRGARAERGATCALLAAIEPDPAAGKALAEEAIDAFLAGGERARAHDLASELIARYPLDEEAVACASAVALAVRDHASAARWLRRALVAWDGGVGEPARPERVAELYRRLGDAERARRNEPAALAAYQRAVALAPDSDGALAARRGIVELAAYTGRQEQSSLIALVEAEQAPADVIRWARQAAHASGGANLDEARIAYELARAQGVALGPDDERFLAAHPERPMAPDEAYAAALDDAERRELVDDPDDGALAELLDLVGEAIALVCPDARTALDRAGLTYARRVGAATSATAAAMYPQIANALGGPQTLMYTADHGPDLRVLLSAPPVVAIGPRLAPNAESSSKIALAPSANAELRFELGRVVELARTRRLFAAGSTPAAFGKFVAAIVQAFGTPIARIEPTIAAEAERLRGAIPLVLRRRISDRLGETTGFATSAYFTACERAADRSGLLACGDIGVAVALTGGPATARHLIQLAASKRYLAARRKLRLRQP